MDCEDTHFAFHSTVAVVGCISEPHHCGGKRKTRFFVSFIIFLKDEGIVCFLKVIYIENVYRAFFH